jgi:hypothetical protein
MLSGARKGSHGVHFILVEIQLRSLMAQNTRWVGCILREDYIWGKKINISDFQISVSRSIFPSSVMDQVREFSTV